MTLSCEDKLFYDLDIKILDRIEINTSNPKIYLDDNQITVRCPEANLEEKGTVNGREYTVVSEEKLRQMLADGMDVVFVCTSHIKNMSSLFRDYKSFDQDISSWDTSNVTSMRRMFLNARSFNKDIGKNNEPGYRYALKWETLGTNRDKPREKPWPPASILYLYKIKTYN